MSTWMIIAAAAAVLAGIITISACVASSRHHRLRQILDSSPEVHGHLVLAPSPSGDLLMNEWRYRQYRRLSRLYRTEQD